MPVMNGSIKIVDSNKEGQRIDNFLITNLKGVPKSLIYRLLRTGKIRVNKKRVKQTYRLQTDDEVYIPDLRESSSQSKDAKISKQVSSKIASSIIYEDESLIVINKPAGIAVHPGTRVSYGVIEILRDLRPAAPYLELVHRLDRQTSGCLLIAKNKTMLNALHELLQTQKIKKEYVALVKGRWEIGNRIVKSMLKSKNKTEDKPEYANHHSIEKHAETSFYPSKVYKEFSLMNVEIGTGRTHQIRIHAAELGHPVVGDQKYGDFSLNRACKKLGLERMFLHAAKISFQLEKNDRKYSFFAPLDKDLEAFLVGLNSQA